MKQAFKSVLGNISLVLVVAVLIKVLIAPALALGDALVLAVVVGHYGFESFTKAQVVSAESIQISEMSIRIEEMETQVSQLSLKAGMKGMNR